MIGYSMSDMDIAARLYDIKKRTTALLDFIPREWKYERIGERQQQQLIQ